MVRHRCSKCKEESYPRHKYHGGVFCDSCIRIIRGFRPDSARRGFFGSIWDMITSLIDKVIHHRHTVKLSVREDSRKVRTQLKAMETRGRGIPPNPEGGDPQKH